MFKKILITTLALLGLGLIGLMAAQPAAAEPQSPITIDVQASNLNLELGQSLFVTVTGEVTQPPGRVIFYATDVNGGSVYTWSYATSGNNPWYIYTIPEDIGTFRIDVCLQDQGTGTLCQRPPGGDLTVMQTITIKRIFLPMVKKPGTSAPTPTPTAPPTATPPPPPPTPAAVAR